MLQDEGLLTSVAPSTTTQANTTMAVRKPALPIRDRGPARPGPDWCLLSPQHFCQTRRHGDCFSISPAVSGPAGSCVTAEAAGQGSGLFGHGGLRELRGYCCSKNFESPAHGPPPLSFQSRTWGVCVSEPRTWVFLRTNGRY